MSCQPGDRFSRLVLIERTDFSKRAKWRVRCDCGVEKIVALSSLMQGRSKSCGCLRRELLLERGASHSRDPIYAIWRSMRDRCNNPSSRAYKNYGARGIRVCKRWDSFQAFRADVGPRPSADHSLERRDNSKGYNRVNVYWATRAEQSRNTRRNFLISHRGKTMCLKDWASEVGISYYTLLDRIKIQGMTVEDALSTPVGHRAGVRK